MRKNCNYSELFGLSRWQRVEWAVLKCESESEGLEYIAPLFAQHGEAGT